MQCETNHVSAISNNNAIARYNIFGQSAKRIVLSFIGDMTIPTNRCTASSEHNREKAWSLVPTTMLIFVLLET